MNELRDAVQPELELIDSRVTAPLKEYSDLLKKIRKTITKREHKVRFLHFYSVHLELYADRETSWVAH